jgi:hypothetical protein
MSPAENPAPFAPSASEYILDNFDLNDRIAMLVLNRGADLFRSIRITKGDNDASGMGRLQKRQSESFHRDGSFAL